MINFYYENKINKLVEYEFSKIVNNVAISLCEQIENEQDMINSTNIKNEILLLNEYIQYLLKNNFTEVEYILDRTIESMYCNQKSLALILLCNRVNKEINMLLNDYDHNMLIYNIIFEKQIYLNKAFHIKNKTLLKIKTYNNFD